MSRFENLHESLKDTLSNIDSPWLVAGLQELCGDTLEERVQLAGSDDVRPRDQL